MGVYASRATEARTRSRVRVTLHVFGAPCSDWPITSKTVTAAWIPALEHCTPVRPSWPFNNHANARHPKSRFALLPLSLFHSYPSYRFLVGSYQETQDHQGCRWRKEGARWDKG